MTTLIEKLRKQNTNLGAREFADHIGVGQSQYLNWEKGLRQVPKEKAEDLAKGLRVNVSELSEYIKD